MPSLTERVAPGMLKWLRRLAETGTWPSSPFLNDPENSLPLMRRGLAEVIQPSGPYMPYAAITKAGREKLAAIDAALKEGA